MVKTVALEAIIKLHKPPPLKSRPVGRGHASQSDANMGAAGSIVFSSGAARL
jgi:hypothetical protein